MTMKSKTFTAALVLAVFLVAGGIVGCRSNIEKQKAAARSAAVAPTENQAEQPAADQKPATAENRTAPEPTDPDKQDKPVSKYHPAAKEKEYEYIDKVWETEQEREIVDYLTKAATAEKAFKIIKKDPKAYLGLLRRSIRADHREVRIQTAVIFGLLKDKSHETFEVMADAVLLDSDPDVRAIAAKAFVVLKPKGAVDVLIRSLDQDPYEAARANAAWALGTIGDPAAVPYLRKATKDDDTFVRLRSVSALMKMKSRAAIPELILRLDDSSPMVRERAHQALREITGTDKGKAADGWLRVYGKTME